MSHWLPCKWSSDSLCICPYLAQKSDGHLSQNQLITVLINFCDQMAIGRATPLDRSYGSLKNDSCEQSSCFQVFLYTLLLEDRLQLVLDYAEGLCVCTYIEFQLVIVMFKQRRISFILGDIRNSVCNVLDQLLIDNNHLTSALCRITTS